MTFKTVYLSQTDPQWKDDLLGFGDPGDTLGAYGCALTSIAMLVSGHGYNETPKSLNEKMKNVGGFSGSFPRLKTARMREKRTFTEKGLAT